MDHPENAASFQPVVILPTYNNSGTLLNVLDRIMALEFPVIVVDDGSSDATPQMLDRRLVSAAPGLLTRIRHQQNHGKAAALQTGFKAAMEAGYSHVVTIDSDGQLDPEQIPSMLALARQSPQALILGVRDATRPDYPVKSRFGRSLSNLMIRLECGARVTDSQCGFRVYPLEPIKRVPCRAGRFGYESEIITRAAWAGIPIRETPVNCRYFPEEARVSHFKIWRDTFQVMTLHLRLLANLLTRHASINPIRQPLPSDFESPAGSETFSRSDRILGLTLLALGLMLRIVYALHYHVNSDEPQHLHVAWSLAHGMTQYRDVFDNHTPLFHILFSFPVRWLGERPNLLILMRLAMLPFYVLILWLTYKTARLFLAARESLWIAILTGLLPANFMGSVEFRTDDLWAALFILAIWVLISGRLTGNRCYLAGLILGATLSVSMKTSLLLACLGAAGLATLMICGKSSRARFFQIHSWTHSLELIAGFLIIPTAIIAWFYSKGALGNLYYGVIQHNMLPGLGSYKQPLWNKFLFVPVVAALLAVARFLIVRRNRFGEKTPHFVFIFLLTGIYIAAVHYLWPLITQQDFLPVWPLAMIASVPLLDLLFFLARSFVLRGMQAGVSWKFNPTSILIKCLAAWFLVILVQDTPGLEIPRLRLNHSSGTKQALNQWRTVLELTKPNELVMDPKGELIFRNRPFYWGMESITCARMRRGLIPNTIAEDLVRSRTCVVYPELERYPLPTREFIHSNYLSIGPVLVPGKMLGRRNSVSPIRFEVKIPVHYGLIMPHGVPTGTLDGVPYRGPRLLGAGFHEYWTAHHERPLALVWDRALRHGFSPFHKPKASSL